MIELQQVREQLLEIKGVYPEEYKFRASWDGCIMSRVCARLHHAFPNTNRMYSGLEDRLVWPVMNAVYYHDLGATWHHVADWLLWALAKVERGERLLAGDLPYLVQKGRAERGVETTEDDTLRHLKVHVLHPIDGFAAFVPAEITVSSVLHDLLAGMPAEGAVEAPAEPQVEELELVGA